jgi:hypothetical protein
MVNTPGRVRDGWAKPPRSQGKARDKPRHWEELACASIVFACQIPRRSRQRFVLAFLRHEEHDRGQGVGLVNEVAEAALQVQGFGGEGAGGRAEKLKLGKQKAAIARRRARRSGVSSAIRDPRFQVLHHRASVWVSTEK